MLLLSGCVDTLPEPSDSAALLGPWDSLVAESVLHLGFEAVAGPDQVLDDSPSELVALAWHEDDIRARQVPGPRGSALLFDGVDDFVYVSDADVLDLAGPYTLLAWIQAVPHTDGPRAWPILDKYAYLAREWTGYAAYLDGAQPYAGIYSGRSTGLECGGPDLGVFDDGAWHLYTATWDGAELAVYMDATLVTACPWTLESLPNADFLEIGTRGGSTFFAGAIDDATVVPRALAPEEITALLP